MRRKDREITDIQKKLAIIHSCNICRLALSDGNQPYIFPLNFGYDFSENQLTLFFHSAKEGKKLEILKKNNRACFEIDLEERLIHGEKPCHYSTEYKSIIGFGKIIIVEVAEEKRNALNQLMKHQTKKNWSYEFTEKELSMVTVYKMVIDEFTGKQNVKK